MRDYPSNKRMMLFSGSSNPELAGRIAKNLGIKLGKMNILTINSQYAKKCKS